MDLVIKPEMTTDKSKYPTKLANLWAPTQGCVNSCSSFIFKEKLTVSVIINLSKSPLTSKIT